MPSVQTEGTTNLGADLSIEVIRDEEDPTIIHLNVNARYGQQFMLSISEEHASGERFYTDIEIARGTVVVLGTRSQ